MSFLDKNLIFFFIFLGHTGQGSSDQTGTAYSYGSSTFVELESEDETKTESEFSYNTESNISSSEVFSSKGSSVTYREWKDVTEIVKE